MSGNILAELPDASAAEVVETLLARPGVRIERIVSHGQSSPNGFWYDQDEHEWVLLLSGSAALEIEGEGLRELASGDFLFLPAHRRHRVTWTAADRETVWLAVFFRAEENI